MKYQLRPLSWTGPVTADRKSSGVFKTNWSETLVLLGDEIEQLGAQGVVLFEVDVAEADLRLDGMLKTRARVGNFPGVVVTFESRFGQLRYASDAYEQRWSGSLPGWQANIRAVALALEALRAVDRYGVSKRGEQYTGWRALTAGSTPAFLSADHAEAWIREFARIREFPDDAPLRQLYRALAKVLHPDTGADPAYWDHLDAARQLLTVAGRL